MSNTTEIWKDFNKIAKKEFSANIYNEFVAKIQPVEINGKTATIAAHSSRAMNFLKSNHLEDIQGIFKKVTGNDYDIAIVSSKDETKEVNKIPFDPSNPYSLLAKLFNDKYDIRRNAFSGMAYIKTKKAKEWEALDGIRFNDLVLELATDRLYMYVRNKHLDTYLNSSKVSVFNPFEEYLRRIEPIWDKEKDGDVALELFSHLSIKEDNEEFPFAKIAKKFFLRCLQCALDPNFTNEHILIFVSGEGMRKTTFINSLITPEMREFYNYGMPEDFKDKDQLYLSSRVFLWFFDEIDSVKKHQLSDLKRFLTNPGMYIRTAYTANHSTYIRTANFIGACNDPSFMRGKFRRFMPFTVNTTIPTNKTDKINKTKFWSQLYRELKTMRVQDLHWTPKEIAFLESLQMNYQQELSEDILISRYFKVVKEKDFDSETFPEHIAVSSTDIHEFLVKKHPELKDSISIVNTGRSLARMGFIQERTKIARYYKVELKNPENKNLFSLMTDDR